MKYICIDCKKIFDEGDIVYEYIGNDPSIPIELDEEDAPLEDIVYDCPYCGSDNIEPYYETKINKKIDNNEGSFILLIVGALIYAAIFVLTINIPMMSYLLIGLLFIGIILWCVYKK